MQPCHTEIHYPFVDSVLSVQQMDAIEISAEDKAAIYHRNAEDFRDRGGGLTLSRHPGPVPGSR
ncbi:MAG: hypothetical protein J7496_17240 [Novosphingobium sp.]|nr:hypothetical protein [Novosphingobium sp.]